MDLLWPDLGPDAAGANLRKAIHQARTAVDGARRGAAGLIEFGGDIVSLADQSVTIDTESFRSALATARRGAAADGYRHALGLYSGELLPDDPYEEWAIAPRRELREEYLAGLAEMADRLEAEGDVAGAIEAARLLVNAEPTREESHATLIRLYALGGRRSDALRRYDHLVEVLDQELGVEPSARLQRLREEISSRRAEEPELNAELWERVGIPRPVRRRRRGGQSLRQSARCRRR